MTGSDALEVLLSRVAASYDGAAFFSLDELDKWPKAAVATFKKARLLSAATPATSTTCDGCEKYCHMPVEIVRRAGRSAMFVLCDKDVGINRVDVRLEKLERWQASGGAIAAYLARELGVNRPVGVSTQVKRWEVGRLRSKRIEPVALTIGDQGLAVEVARYPVRLDEVLSWKAGRLDVDRQALSAFVDNPASVPAGRTDLAARVAEIDAAIADNRRRGRAAPVETAVKAFGITRQRLNQMRKTLKKRRASTLT